MRLPAASFDRRAARAAHSRFFHLLYSENGRPNNRFAVVVGKSVDKRATRRNALKRFFRDRLGAWPAAGLDVVLMVSPQASARTAPEIEKELNSALLKIKKSRYGASL